ncbi:MAG: DUF1501 domain-containing protein [Rhodobacteraceae bacterium]|nr:DUF1501 domain-containing protein [Paracoccaceae bacterium]
MLNRRMLLKTAGAFACSAAAHPFLTTVTLAGSDGGQPLGDHRLVVIILRGAMDGLDVVQPRGDGAYAGLRPTLAQPDAADLDGFFALHSGLGGLMPLWQAGQLGFVHATSTPYRDKRSHFSGQDQLEAGTGMDLPASQVRDGWLNRMLQAVPGVRAETAFAVGNEEMKLLHGPAAVREWAPDTRLDLSPQAQLLLEHVYHDDPLFLAAASDAFALGGDPDMMMDDSPAGALKGARLDDVDKLVRFAADRLREDTRIAAFSLSGWDTHKGQGKGLGRALMRLERAILQMQKGLGAEVWGKTTVLAMTEFGRTARENGTVGTDHGTGGVMLVAGGAIRGGKVYGDWPGLDEAALYDRRDLMPTSDVRQWAAHAMQGMFGLDRAVLEGAVFPGLQMGASPGLIL